MEQKVVRWKLIFAGKVQFVGFRYAAMQTARGLELTGWVRNRSDGRVELEAQGPAPALRQLILKLKARPFIRITALEQQSLPPLPGEKKFRVLADGDG